MKKKKVTKFLSVILAFACIVSTWPKIHVFAEKSSVEANENVVIQEEFKEPQGGVLPQPEAKAYLSLPLLLPKSYPAGHQLLQSTS